MYADTVVYGEGPADAEVMLIGERPGAAEARHRKPFCGPAGRDLSRYLSEVGIERGSIYVTNTVKTFRQYEKPSLEEIVEWLPVLQDEISTVQPRVIGLLGTYAVEAVMSSWWKSAVLNVRHGTVWMLPETGVQLVPMYHPAYGIYSPERIPDLQYDFRRLAEAWLGVAQPVMLGSSGIHECKGAFASDWGYEYDHRESVTKVEESYVE